MEITMDLVRQLEKLSMLELSEGEREDARSYLRDVLAQIDIIGEADTQGVEPLTHLFPTANVTREDVVVPSPEPSVILANAPHRKGTCFRVPKTVE